MNLGLNIKKYRLEKEMTQEELAEYTGVSSRAISRWENGITYPDILLLPILANIFEVTVDELLDVDVYKKEQDIKSILKKDDEYTHIGNLDKSIELLRQALKKYPNNYNIMNNLMNSLFCYYCAKTEGREHLLNEAKELAEKILSKSDEKNIRESAIQTLVYVYPKTNELDKAIELINKQPNIYSTREMLLEHVLKGNELDVLLKHNIIKITEWFNSIIKNMSYKKEPQVKIDLTNKYIQLMKLVFEDKEMGFYHNRMYVAYLNNAKNYAKMDKIKESIDSLIECINHAIKLEASVITTYTSLLLNGMTNDISSSQTNSMVSNKNRILKDINSNFMVKVRECIRFKEVEDLLNKLK